jgi:tRNA pseudouridine38-40 synthase
VRLWAKISYDGTDFAGFQIQAQERTVQGEIERAVAVVTGKRTRVIGAGRTDRGVHARGQVIGFEVDWKHSLEDLQRAMNAVLAADVAVLRVGQAPQNFHPRFSAVGRSYQYTLFNHPWRSPLQRRTAWHIAPKLDVGQMAQAGQALLGTHDFASFGSPPQGQSTVRCVTRIDWRQKGPFCFFVIEANAFLYRMVRSIVGTLVLVGLGRMAPAQVDAILDARDRSQVRQVAPAHGLCLMRVDYGSCQGVFQ